MRNLGSIQNPQDIATKDYVDNKKKVIISKTPPEDTSVIWINPTKIMESSSGGIAEIPEEYVTEDELNAKGYATISYVDDKLTSVKTPVQDTGWLDITDKVKTWNGWGDVSKTGSLGKWYLRRIGDTVLLEVVAFRTNVVIQNVPTGYSIGFNDLWHDVRGKPGDSRIDAGIKNGNLWMINHINNNASVNYARLSWMTTDPFPILEGGE